MYKTILLSIALILIASICFVACGDDPVSPASFKFPGVYSGTYQYTSNWLETNGTETTSINKVIFEFRSNSVFFMDIDSTESDPHFCVVDTGNFDFTGDSIYLTVIVQNLLPQICAPAEKPEGGFTYSVQGDYLVFEYKDMDARIFKKIELYGR